MLFVKLVIPLLLASSPLKQKYKFETVEEILATAATESGIAE